MFNVDTWAKATCIKNIAMCFKRTLLRSQFRSMYYVQEFTISWLRLAALVRVVGGCRRQEKSFFLHIWIYCRRKFFYLNLRFSSHLDSAPAQSVLQINVSHPASLAFITLALLQYNLKLVLSNENDGLNNEFFKDYGMKITSIL